MLVLIGVLVTLNLCLGYALGACVSRAGGLPELRRRGPRPRAEEPLVRPVEPAPPRPAPAAGGKARKQAAPEPENAVLLAGLTAFQEQLARMGKELSNAQEDAQAFDACAKNIQQANHAYLESTQLQIEQLPAEHILRESIAAGAEHVGKISDEFDAIVDEGLEDQAARARLVEKSSLLKETVAEARQIAEERTRAAISEAVAAAGLATIDNLLTQIDQALQDDEPRFRTAVLMRRDHDQAEDGDDAPAGLTDRLQAHVARSLAEALPTAEHAAYRQEDQFLLLLDDGDLQSMIDLVDELRQRIAETTFVMDGAEFKTTVTCAIADVPGAGSRGEVLSRLEEAMEESARFGANRTFHHDGKFPTPTPPADAEVGPLTVEL